MIVKGYSLALVETEPKQADRLWRIYGTTLRKRRDGAFVPRPGAWELVREIPLRVDGRRLTIPDFKLEHTGPGGYHFYTLVHVRPDGREAWHEGDEFTFPPSAAERFGPRLTVAKMLLYGLELKGVIAPGQLGD